MHYITATLSVTVIIKYVTRYMCYNKNLLNNKYNNDLAFSPIYMAT